jgi:phospholipid transport system substrate-binding protein
MADRMRRILSRLAMMLLAAAPLPAPAAAAPPDAAAFMTDIANRVLAIMSDRKTPEAQREQQFLALARQDFDIPQIARFVLGRCWRSASAAERQRYVAAFGTYMLRFYWARFMGYGGETVKVTGRRTQGTSAVEVTMEVGKPGAGGPPTEIDWWLERSGDRFKIEDASVDGVSQALTYRDEFATYINENGGVPALIARLQRQAEG